MAAQTIRNVLQDISAAELAQYKKLKQEMARLKQGIVTIDDISEILKISVATIRTKLSRNTFRPLPFDKYPYRWRRSDVELELQTPRTRLRTRRHGFAAAKAKRDAEE